MRFLILAGAVFLASTAGCWADPTTTATTAPVSPRIETKPATTAPQADAKKKAHDEQVFCEEVLDTGSRLHKQRICMTRAEREKRQQESRDAMQGVFDTERNTLPPPQGAH